MLVLLVWSHWSNALGKCLHSEISDVKKDHRFAWPPEKEPHSVLCLPWGGCRMPYYQRNPIADWQCGQKMLSSPLAVICPESPVSECKKTHQNKDGSSIILFYYYILLCIRLTLFGKSSYHFSIMLRKRLLPKCFSLINKKCAWESPALQSFYPLECCYRWKITELSQTKIFSVDEVIGPFFITGKSSI